jgi:hypothetical protein
MKKIKFILPFVLLLFCSAVGNYDFKHQLITERINKETNVYICDSENSYAYHSSNTCRGINRCKSQILEVTKSDAVNKYQRRACKICY